MNRWDWRHSDDGAGKTLATGCVALVMMGVFYLVVIIALMLAVKAIFFKG